MLRACIRDCMIRGEHLVEHPVAHPCKGCVPADARDGALICERCYRRLRSLLEDAADLVAHLRSIADPTKAVALDRARVDASLPELPAPVAADLIDASNDITLTLNAWADHLVGEDRPPAGLPAGAMADEAHALVHLATTIILDDLTQIVNDSQAIRDLSRGVLDTHKATDGDRQIWSLADVEQRWPLNDKPRWAPVPCPNCSLLQVRINPGRGGRPARYRCATITCGWEANSEDDRGLWAAVFADAPPPEVLPHEPDWWTVAEAARRMKVTAGTIHTWIREGHISKTDGRLWGPDVRAEHTRRHPPKTAPNQTTPAPPETS